MTQEKLNAIRAEFDEALEQDDEAMVYALWDEFQSALRTFYVNETKDLK